MRPTFQQLVRQVTPAGTILQRTAKSGIWRLGTQIVSRGLQLVMLIVLARLLSPRDFGLMGIALLTLGATRQCTKIGLNAALIQQQRDNIDDYLDTTWCLEIARGLLIAGVIFAIAPAIGSLFGEPAAIDLVRVIGLAPLLYAFRNPGVVYFKKDLAFHKDFLYRASGATTQFIVGVGYALVSPTVWALVFAFISRDAIQLFLSYLIHDYRPRPAFDLDTARELIDYGKWITGSSIVVFLYSKGADAFVGWYLSATALGLYQYAYRLADAPSTEFSEVIAQVMFPAFSKLQEDIGELRTAVLHTTRFTAFLAFPISFGIVLIAPSFVTSVLGPDWTPMIPVLQILAIYGLVHAISRNFGSLWKAVGRPDLTAKIPFIGVVLMAITIWPATARWGLTGTALVVVGMSVGAVLPLSVHLTARMIDARSIDIYREYCYPCVASGVMFAVLWAARPHLAVEPLVELVILVPTGAVIYFGCAMLLERRFDWGIGSNLKLVLNGIIH